MIIAAILITARSKKNFNIVNLWMLKLEYIHSTGYYVAMTKYELFT